MPGRPVIASKCTGRRYSFLAVMAAAACFSLAGAPPPKGAPARIRIPVWLDSSHEWKSGDFHVKLEGAGCEVLDVKGPQDDLMLLIVADLAGDLAMAEPAKDALIQRVQDLSPRTYVGLLRAQDGLRVVVDPTPDRVAVSNAIRNLPISGKAGLLDTIDVAGQIADSVLNKTAVRVAILYVSDSDIANYRDDYTNPVINRSDDHDLSRKFSDQLVQEKVSKLAVTLSAQQTPVFIVHLNIRADRLSEAYQNGLKRLADTTAGSAIFCRSSSEVAGAIARSFDLITSHYSLTLAVPEKLRRSVQVQLTAAGPEGGLHGLNYRTRMLLRAR